VAVHAIPSQLAGQLFDKSRRNLQSGISLGKNSQNEEKKWKKENGRTVLAGLTFPSK